MPSPWRHTVPCTPYALCAVLLCAVLSCTSSYALTLTTYGIYLRHRLLVAPGLPHAHAPTFLAM
eukprot:scaffold12174_cov121-Isochrysis_galbana.AAC.4